MEWGAKFDSRASIRKCAPQKTRQSREDAVEVGCGLPEHVRTAMTGKTAKSPYVVLSDSLQKIDLIFRSKREDLVEKLREGNAAWEQRKQQYPENQIPSETPSAEDIQGVNANGMQQAKKRRLLKDNDHPSSRDIADLLRHSIENPREKKVALAFRPVLTDLQTISMPGGPLECGYIPIDIQTLEEILQSHPA